MATLLHEPLTAGKERVLRGIDRVTGSSRRLVSWRRPIVVVVHLVLFTLAYEAAWLLRFDFDVRPEYAERFLYTLPFLLALRVAAFYRYRLFEGMWRYVGVRDLVGILKATTLSSLGFVALVMFAFRPGFPRSVLLLEWGLTICAVGGVRMATRMYREARSGAAQGTKRALIVGAGDAGEGLLRETMRNPALDYEVVGFVDDDVTKQRARLHGVAVIGTTLELSDLVERHDVDEILIAVPSAANDDYRRIVRTCQASGVAFKTVPGMMDLVAGRATISHLHEVGPEDLLPREAVHLDVDLLRAEHTGRSVLVTGAGGSIGSELARQVARFEPGRLVLLERAESALYLMQRELEQKHPGLKVVPVVGDVCDREKVDFVMATQSPDVVYHAAAYKHVPLMEEYPLDAIRNNVFGTKWLAEAAAAAGVGRFVLISTDKAVRPVGIMGMTKRAAECVMRSMQGNGTIFTSVRFGNVLGSDGSVLPLFRKQIAAGGPVTVTDPDATRYFMLIPEAAQLVLQAGSIGTGAEVFFLDMGEPVRILDLAENLIRMSGKHPGGDIEIQVTGLRPGERLAEELKFDSEEYAPSAHEKIFVVRGATFDRDGFEAALAQLEQDVAARDAERARVRLQELVARF